MNIKKIVITEGDYLDKHLRIMISFNENDEPVDIIFLDYTIIGNSYLATVEKVLKDIDACILKLDDKKTKGFIENKKLNPDKFVFRTTKKNKVSQGDKFWVKVVQDKKSTKPCSCIFLDEEDSSKGFLSHYILSLKNECTVISDIEEIYAMDSYCQMYDDEFPLWQLYGFTSILDKALSKIVFLKNDANIVIEPTEALTVIDVNSGKNYGKTNIVEINRLALKEIANQIRLRNISGIIVVDLLRIEDKETQKTLIDDLKQFIADDMAYVSVHGFTKLGLLEITRSRYLSPIYEIFTK